MAADKEQLWAKISEADKNDINRRYEKGESLWGHFESVCKRADSLTKQYQAYEGEPKDEPVTLKLWNGVKYTLNVKMEGGTVVQPRFIPIQELRGEFNSGCRGQDHWTPFPTYVQLLQKSKGLSLEEIRRDYDERKWEHYRGEINQRIMEALEKIGDCMTNVSKIVAVGTGKLPANPPSGDMSTSHRNAKKLSLLLEIREYISKRKHDGKSIPCHVHPTSYTANDKEFLGSKGLNILGGYLDFLKEVDDTTLLVAISPRIAIRQFVAEFKRRPKVILWESHENTIHRYDPPSPRVDKMLTEYDRVWKTADGPVDAGNEANEMRSEAIYVRKDTSATEPQSGATSG